MNRDLCAVMDAPADKLEVHARRGRPRVWRSLAGQYEIHRDGRVRDRHRHVVTDPAILAALSPQTHVRVVLACCGAPCRVDRPVLAIAHYAACVYRTLAEYAGWQSTAAARLDRPDAAYSRDVTARRPVARGDLGEPQVLMHNGQYGAKRRLRIVPWSTAIQNLFATEELADAVSKTR